MLYRVEGIIIRSMDYGEGNKIVTLLTNTNGKVGVLIRGAKKLKSRYGSLSQLFTHGEFAFFRTSGLGTLSSGEIITSHHRLREELDLMAHASYAAELTDRALQDEEAGSFLFEQLKACFQALEDGKDPAVTIHLYEMKILQAAGYAPVLHACASCGREEGPFVLSPRLGGLLCPRCRYTDPSALRPGEGAIKLLRLLGTMDMRRLGNIQIKTETKAELTESVRALMDYHMGLRLKSRAFLDSLAGMQAAAPQRRRPPGDDPASPI
ncbi:DNA repair protein RecO [Paenibacillus sambharensis]|uniref:DNA repair protein RecO n=1 Tax=Paenibacillus sambharensis TaxID=1803190 RepID=A0A2W1LQD9_9BACL|nr:DNA repair protein RecO [Paenibacillus sambharensis]PZD94041.1 DNA repair protein RecO [Paenibacillus sambharensis]